MDRFEKCKSCKYYQAHYVVCGLRYFPIEGHCMNRVLTKSRKRDIYRLQEDCSLWEENSEVLQKRRDSIKSAIFNIEEHLQQLLCILENDSAK